VPHTLLLADDSVTIQRVIELTFADENVQVVAVSDGEQAIARLDAAPPDIVLADIGMPGKNGYEVAQYIKQTPRLAHIPVVLLAGAFEPVDQAKASAAGCDGVLAKPFEPQQVIGRVKELLARGGAAAPTKVEAAAPPTSRFVERVAPTDIDSYFDRLGAAFAGLGKDAPPPNVPAPPPNVPPPAVFDKLPNVKPFAPPGAAAAPPKAAEPPAAPAAAAPEPAIVPPTTDFQTASAPSTLVAGRVAPEPVAPTTTAASTPAPAIAPPVAIKPVLPKIADAFAALLAAEQNEPPPAAPPNWPSTTAAAPPAGVTDELIEQVTRRVLEHMSDRIVRETIADIVAGVAERLVRDEIERIKTTIK
jgi:CheY-like chemotaxis protein